MERDGILLRHQFNEIPPHVEYSLTEKGRTLSSVLLAIADWGMEN
jgi:DNA-binding HxlR family transcriptional regulator